MSSNEEWEAIHQSRMWGLWPDIHVVRQVKKFIAQWEDHSYRIEALDIGCGAGACSAMMGDEGMEVTAIDVSKTAIINAPHHHNVKLLVADAQTVELQPESFDFILDNLSLTYVQEPSWLRIMSWLKPNGWLIHASFETAPKGTPVAYEHKEPGNVVERHSSWVEGNAFSFVVRKYVKPG